MICALLGGLLMGLIFGFASLGLSLIFGVMDILDMAQGGYLILGAYGALWLWKYLGIRPIFSFVIIAPAMFGLGIIIYQGLIKSQVLDPSLTGVKKFMWSLIMSLAILLFISNAINFFYTPIPKSILGLWGAVTVPLAGGFLSLSKIVAGMLALGFFFMVYLFLNKTKRGKAIRASSLNKDLATTIGIKTDSVYSLTYGLSAAIAGCAGVLLSMIYSLSPTAGLGWVVLAFIIVIVGGFGSLKGTMLAALIVLTSRSLFISYLDPTWGPMVAYVICIVTLFVLPYGLLGRR